MTFYRVSININFIPLLMSCTLTSIFISYNYWVYFKYFPIFWTLSLHLTIACKSKGHPAQAEVAQGVPCRLRPRIFLTFGTTRLVGRQSYAPTAFTPGEIPGTHFQGLSRPQGTWFRRGEPLEKIPVTPPGNDPGSVRLVAQCLNHYATPGPRSV
jgi:hypothetical protein